MFFGVELLVLMGVVFVSSVCCVTRLGVGGVSSPPQHSNTSIHRMGHDMTIANVEARWQSMK